MTPREEMQELLLGALWILKRSDTPILSDAEREHFAMTLDGIIKHTKEL